MKKIFIIFFAIASFVANIGVAATLSAEAQKVLYQNFEIQEYAEGAFFVSYKLPNTLFFNKKIEAPQYEEFRRAVVEHNVTRVVLNSPGGSIYEGLLIAGMIFDKKTKINLNLRKKHWLHAKKQTCLPQLEFVFPRT